MDVNINQDTRYWPLYEWGI